MTLAEFTAFAVAYPKLISGRDAAGNVDIVPALESDSAENEVYINYYLIDRYMKNGRPGTVYGPSAGFLLLGEAVRCRGVAYAYRRGSDAVEEVRGWGSAVLSGEDVLPGIKFQLAELNV